MNEAKHVLILPEQYTFHYGDSSDVCCEDSQVVPDFCEKLNKALKLNNTGDIETITGKLISAAQSGSISYRQVRKEVSKFTLLLKQFSAENRLDLDDFIDEALKDKLYSPDDIHEFTEAFLQAVHLASEQLTDKKRSRNSELVESVKQYITANISLELSLNSVADAIHISPFYLSKLFKEEAKINYIDFVTNLKMEKAKELLLESDSSVEEISLCIGYNYATYFARKFKEYTGKTPNEFRKGGSLLFETPGK